MKGRIRRPDAPVQPQGLKLPEIGKIKIGEKATNAAGKEYPVSLDYFKAVGKYAGLFYEVYDEKPSSITIFFVSDDPSESCEEFYELRDAKGDLFGKGDGETFLIWDGGAYQPYRIDEYPDIMEEAAKAAGKPWKVNLMLRFLIPKIRGVLGVWTLRTKGDASSIPQIRDTFDSVQQMASTVVKVPFDLQVEKVKSQKPGDKSVFPVLRLVPSVTSENLEQVRGFLEAGHEITEIRGLLTDEVIERSVPKQIGPAVRSDDIPPLFREEDDGEPFEPRTEPYPGDATAALYNTTVGTAGAAIAPLSVKETIAHMQVEVEQCAEFIDREDALRAVQSLRLAYGERIKGWPKKDIDRFAKAYETSFGVVRKKFTQHADT